MHTHLDTEGKASQVKLLHILRNSLSYLHGGYSKLTACSYMLPQIVFLPRHCLKNYKSSVKARGIVQQLRVCTVLEKDVSSIPSTHIRQLITAYNSNSKKSNVGTPQFLKIKQIPLLHLLVLSPPHPSKKQSSIL